MTPRDKTELFTRELIAANTGRRRAVLARIHGCSKEFIFRLRRATLEDNDDWLKPYAR
jgi:hypothetical protein